MRGALRTLRWLAARGFLTPGHLRTALRYLWVRLRHPEVEFEGYAFVGPGVRFEVRRGYGKLIIGRWAHLGERVKLRAHEGVLRIGEKAVIGYDSTINCYLDIEIGAATIIGDRVYVCDFDHRTDEPDVPIKDQGLIKSPVRIGPDCWLGTGVTVTRGTDLGKGSVAAAHAVLRGTLPARSICAGVPARVVADRVERHRLTAEERAYVKALGDQAEAEVRKLLRGG
ncbi:MAG TPA: acyltransferase [Microlunatus sp.]|nr:acyltransferase [Microlunatus sp.]